MEMGQEIRQMRTNRGIAQEALTAALNVNHKAVSKWECGSSEPIFSCFRRSPCTLASRSISCLQ